MKKKILFIAMILLAFSSVCIFAQEITIYLESSTQGRVVCNAANVNTTAWYRSTIDLRGTPWLVAGDYTGEVDRFINKQIDVIRIYGGPNNISRSRDIAIHGGAIPEHSDGCVVIAISERDKIYSRYLYGNRTITIRVVDNR